MRVVKCSLFDVPSLLEKLLLEKYEPHVSPIRSIFQAFHKVIDMIFYELQELRKQIQNNENGVVAIEEAGGLLRAAFGDRRVSFYEPEAIDAFLDGLASFDKFRLYIHSVSHIEVRDSGN